MTLRVLYCIVSLVADEAANNFIIKSCAGMAELADAQASGACGSNIVRVQVPLPALFFVFRSPLFSQIPFFFAISFFLSNLLFNDTMILIFLRSVKI